MSQFVDEQGQPRFALAQDSITDRQIDELIWICKGISADGVITPEEANYLSRWMESRRGYVDRFPFDVLYARLREMLSDGDLDDEESSELLDIIRKMTGEDKEIDAIASTSLPLDQPAPPVQIRGKVFVFTGIFTVGSRKKCEEIIEDLGGKVRKNISKSIDYLVVGDIGSEYWAHSTHGRKIEKALLYKKQGIDIAIISEHHWIHHV